MKKCSASLTIKEMQIKITFRFHLTSDRLAIIKKTENKCWQGCRKKEPPCTVVEGKNHYGNQYEGSSKTKRRLTS
jgi:hypothetical protein